MPSVCQAPLRRQPASAPSPSTISFVPLTRNLSPAAPSLAPSTALGTREGLLWYGICVPCSKRLPGVRDAFSGALGVKNRLLRYGRYIRYRKPPSTVRNRHSATKKGSWGTRRIFKGPQNSTCYIERIFKPRRTADSTDCGQPTVVRDAFSGAPVHENPLLTHATHFQRRAVPKAASCRTGRNFSARNSPRSLCSLRPFPPFPSFR